MALAKLKFCVFLPFYAFQAKDKHPWELWRLLRDTVLECEQLGYHSIWLDDHLMYGNWPILECWTTLSALSATTNRIRLGTMVSCSSHRNPAVLAKMASTVDVLSNGRLELGIGAGTQKIEHVAYGLGFPKANVRIERLNEALAVIRRLWTEEKANFTGEYYTLKDAVCEPKPIQKPHPPITVGGSGEKLLKVTAQYADRFDWGFLPSLDAYKRKLEVLEDHCKSIGRNFLEIERSCWPSGQVLIGSSQKEADAKVSQLKPAGVTLEEFKKNSLAGTPAECRERLNVYRDLGVTCFMLYFGDLPNLEGLKLFADNFIERSFD